MRSKTAPVVLATALLACVMQIACDTRETNNKSSGNEDASSRESNPIFFVVKEINDTYQSAPGSRTTYHEVEVVVQVGNRARRTLQFDQLQAVFRAGNEPMSSATYVLRDDGIVATYSLKGQSIPPTIPAEGIFEIEYGYATVFVLASANANFGLLKPGSPRSVVVTFHREGARTHGPFVIDIPWLE